MKFNAAVLLGTALSLAPSAMVAAEPDPFQNHLIATATEPDYEPHHSVEARVEMGGPGPRIETTLTATIDGTQVAIPTDVPRFEGGHGPKIIPLPSNTP